MHYSNSTNRFVLYKKKSVKLRFFDKKLFLMELLQLRI